MYRLVFLDICTFSCVNGGQTSSMFGCYVWLFGGGQRRTEHKVRGLCGMLDEQVHVKRFGSKLSGARLTALCISSKFINSTATPQIHKP